MLKLYALTVLLPVYLFINAQNVAKDPIIFIDTHNDVLSKQLLYGPDLAVSQPGLNFDLIKASKGNLAAQVFSVWCDEVYGPGKAFARANREIDSLLALIQRNPGKIKLVSSSSELKKALKEGRFAAMIGVEGGHMIEERMDFLDSLINRGNSRGQQLLNSCGVACGQGRPQFPDGSAQAAPVAAVNIAALFILAHALFR